MIDQTKCDPSCGGKCIEYCPIDDTIVEVTKEMQAVRGSIDHKMET